MPAFAYLGDHSETRLFGLVFPRDVAVEVTDPAAVAKLLGNSHFAAVHDGVQVLEADEAPESAPKRRGRPPGRKEG